MLEDGNDFLRNSDEMEGYVGLSFGETRKKLLRESRGRKTRVLEGRERGNEQLFLKKRRVDDIGIVNIRGGKWVLKGSLESVITKPADRKGKA